MASSLKKNKYELMVPASSASLAVIRWVISRLAMAAGLPPDAVDQVEMAVDEACTNVLDHAYREMMTKPPLHVVIENTPEAMIFDVIDQGQTFDYAAYEEPIFPEHWLEGNERGVGLYLIHRFMDNVEYETVATLGNRMRLIKRHASQTVSGTAMPLSEAPSSQDQPGATYTPAVLPESSTTGPAVSA